MKFKNPLAGIYENSSYNTGKVPYTLHIIGVSVPFRFSNAEIKVIR